MNREGIATMARFGKLSALLDCLSRILVTGLCTLVCAQTTLAEDSESPAGPYSASGQDERSDFGGPDAVGRRLESDRVSTATPLELGFLDPWYEWKDSLQQEHGFAFGAEYNSVYLRASDRLPGADNDVSGGIFRFSAVWEAFGRGSAHPGNLTFLIERTDEFTNTGPSSLLGESVGYAGISNLPYNDDGWRLNTLYWDQKFRGGKYEMVGGYLDISDYVDVFPLVSPWTDFFNYAFSIGVGALDLPSDGALGFAGAAWLTDNVYAMAGFVDENADATDPGEGFDTFFNDRDYFKHFEIGWTGASQEAYYLNNAHLTLWHADERDDLGVEDGWGGVLSFNHAVGANWLAFVRAGWAEDSGSLLERSVSIGGGYTPGGLELLGSGHQLGFGVNWGEPNDALFGADLKDQYAAEAYFRWQLADEIAITPSAQLLIDPALNPDDDTAWVFGVRARLAF
ncbi:MAG: carbohydrate porin [Gammaproteobacteria bacterium]|jgi:porin